MQGNESLAAREPAGAAVPCSTKPPCRILVADDDSDLRRLNARVLKRSGYEVDTVEDGAAAWEALQDKPFNLLITDHHMPGLTGIELVKKLRAANMDLPVIMATGKLPARELAKNPSLQLAALLPKPFSFHELLEAVRNVLHGTGRACEQLELLPAVGDGANRL